MRCKPFDYLTFIYLFVVTLLIFIGRNRVWHWPGYIFGNGILCLLIVLLILLETRFSKNRWLTFFRYTYPLWSTAFLYNAIEGYVLILHGRFLDASFNSLEKNCFGVYPNLWLEQFVSKPLTEFFMAAYFSYYFYIIIPPLLLFFRKRYADLAGWLFVIMLAFYVSYLGFVLLPVLGPIFSLKHAFAIKQLQGYFFTPLQNIIMHGDPKGSCFPSSHVTVAWVALLSIRKYFGAKPFWLILPFTICLSIAVVYNRYHYVLDLLGGLVTAGCCMFVSGLILTWVSRSQQNRA